LSSPLFLVLPNWKKVNREIWDSLEKSVLAPPDVYIELLRFLCKELGIDPSIETLNDPQKAREEFRKAHLPPNEDSCISILEGFYDVLSEFDTDIAEKYRVKLDRFLAEHNLRYSLTPACRFQLTIQGLLMSQCAYLHKSVVGHQNIPESVIQLQASLSHLSDRNEAASCIRIASNLLEGLAKDRATSQTNTLTSAIDHFPSDLFPHSSLKECMKNLYRFWSDYPNIRHAGTPGSRVRDLKRDDALLSIALTMAFGSFLSDDNACESILSGNL